MPGADRRDAFYRRARPGATASACRSVGANALIPFDDSLAAEFRLNHDRSTLVGGPSNHSTYRAAPAATTIRWPFSETPVRAGGCHHDVACRPASTAPALAAERFVSTTGSDSTGNGSRAAPYRTLSRVLSPSAGIVRAGDVVTLLATASNPVFNECDVRLRVPLTIRSDAARRAHIHCDIQTPDSVTIQIDPDASGSRFVNQEISGGRYYGVFLQTDWDEQGNPGGRGASNIVIEDVYVHDTGRDAIKITPKSDYVTIRRAEIARSGAGYAPGTPLDDKNAEGIDNVNGSFMIVEDSYIHDTATTGVYFRAAPPM